MKLDEKCVVKIDPLLQEALIDAEGDQLIRAVMVLGPENEEIERKYLGQKIEQAQFSSRESYRQALIERRKRQLEASIGNTLQALQELSLAPRGGKITRTVVIEGQARQILEALHLPGVRHAILDQPIRLIEPRRRAAGKVRAED